VDVYKTDEEQAESIKRWFRENGISLVTGVMLGLAVLFGFKSWTEYGQRSAEAASNVFVQFSMAATQDTETAVKVYDELIKSYSDSEYAVLASLQMGKLRLEKNDVTAAEAHLQWALEHAKVDGLKHTARLRLARLKLSEGDADAADKLIAGINDPSYTALYEELRGDIARTRGDMAAAHAAYERALAAMPASQAGRALIEAKRDNAVSQATGEAS
jgi:predicted negative regulator of RcsB-dependent stress response